MAIPYILPNQGLQGLTPALHGKKSLLYSHCKSSRFLLTRYMSHILHSTAVATASRSTAEGTMRVLCSYCLQSSFSAFCYSSVRVPSKYPQRYCDLSSPSGTVYVLAKHANCKHQTKIKLKMVHFYNYCTFNDSIWIKYKNVLILINVNEKIMQNKSKQNLLHNWSSLNRQELWE